ARPSAAGAGARRLRGWCRTQNVEPSVGFADRDWTVPADSAPATGRIPIEQPERFVIFDGLDEPPTQPRVGQAVEIPLPLAASYGPVQGFATTIRLATRSHDATPAVAEW